MLHYIFVYLNIAAVLNKKVMVAIKFKLNKTNRKCFKCIKIRILARLKNSNNTNATISITDFIHIFYTFRQNSSVSLCDKRRWKLRCVFVFLTAACGASAFAALLCSVW